MSVHRLRVIQSQETSDQPRHQQESVGERDESADNYLKLAKMFLKVGQELI